VSGTVLAANDTALVESVSRLPRGVQQLPSGRYRARISVQGRLISLDTCDTAEEAAAVRASALAKLQDAPAPTTSASSLRSWQDAYFAFRVRNGLRNVDDDRTRWDRNVTTSQFYDWPVKAIKTRDVQEWVDAMSDRFVDPPHAPNRRGNLPKRRRSRTMKKLARQSVCNAKNILQGCFKWLVGRGVLQTNPAIGVTVAVEHRTQEPWTYLELDEQEGLLACAAIPEQDRLLIAWQMFTGMRPGETASLQLVDVHLAERPYVTVRFGKEGRPPKNGRIRRIELGAQAVRIARRWLELLPSHTPHNPKKLMWPLPRGSRRDDTRLIRRWHEYLDLAKVHDARIYDLRHTCASSLAAGWWGRRWSLLEIKEALGHSSIAITTRYAHLGETALRAAADEMDAAQRNGVVKLPGAGLGADADGGRSKRQRGRIGSQSSRRSGRAV
jgi:integrase